MTAGRLRDRAAFERRDGVIDDTGNLTGWAPINTVWCDLREQTGGQDNEAGGLRGTIRATARVRNTAEMRNVNVNDRVTIRGKLWDVRSPGAIIGRDKALLEFELVAGGTA